MVELLTLSTGLVSLLTAYAFVGFWNAAERHFPDIEGVHVLTMGVSLPDFEDLDVRTPLRAAEQLRIDFPDLDRVARVSPIGAETLLSTAGEAARVYAVAADPEFLEIFPLPFLAGDRQRALAAPRSAILARDTAERLFGLNDPVGRRLLIDNRVEVTLTGIIDTVPEPSHLGRSSSALLPFELLVSHDVRDALAGGSGAADRWLDSSSITYLRLPERGSLTAGALASRLPEFVTRHVSAEERARYGIEFGLVPVTSLLRRGFEESLFPDFATTGVSDLFLALGTLVLLVACLNHASLASARAARRAREVGLREVLGARPAQVAAQHLLEAAVLSLLALAVALTALRLASPWMQRVLDADPWSMLLTDPHAWWRLLLVVLGVTLMAGSYPALVLSRLLPMETVRGGSLRIAPNRLGGVLVCCQFTIASFLLIALAVVSMQNADFARTGLGTSGDQLLAIENTFGANGVDAETLRTELLQLPHVRAVTDTGTTPWLDLGGTMFNTLPDATGPTIWVMTRSIGPDFFRVFDIELLAGRLLSAERADDQPVVVQYGQSDAPDRPFNVVVDRAFIERFGFASPEAAIDELVYAPAWWNDGPVQPYRIVGVTETVRWAFYDFAGATGTLYRFWGFNPLVIVRLTREDVAGALQRIDALWQNLAPTVPIKRRFLDDVFDQAYGTFARINRVLNALALLAFVIATAGLIAMATLAAARRMREVAVRKLHGARTGRIVAMLLVAFAKPVIIANLFAWPMAYFAARAYLDMFLHPITLTPAPFVFSLAVTLAVALAAITAQAVRAARARPADVLRTG